MFAWVTSADDPFVQISVNSSDIIAVRSTDKQRKIYTIDGYVGYVDKSIEKISDFDPKAFLRIHRNCYVRISAIESFDIILQPKSSNKYAIYLLTLKGISRKFKVSRKIWKRYQHQYNTTK